MRGPAFGAGVGALALALAACSHDDGLDTRCHGAAQVPAWDVAYTVSFADTGSTVGDTFQILLHHTVDAAGTTGPVVPVATYDGVAWFTLAPSGTVDVRDTVIDLVHHDTTVGVVTTLTPHPHGDGVFSGGYVAVDLAHCTADLGAQFYGELQKTTDGVPQGTDTTKVGYVLFQNVAVDSAAVAGGWSFPAQKVATRAGAYDFVHDRQYLELALSGRYSPGVDVDSATVSITVTPAAAAATGRWR